MKFIWFELKKLKSLGIAIIAFAAYMLPGLAIVCLVPERFIFDKAVPHGNPGIIAVAIVASFIVFMIPVFIVIVHDYIKGDEDIIPVLIGVSIIIISIIAYNTLYSDMTPLLKRIDVSFFIGVVVTVVSTAGIGICVGIIRGIKEDWRKIYDSNNR